jgi:hypothetical protein
VCVCVCVCVCARARARARCASSTFSMRWSHSSSLRNPLSRNARGDQDRWMTSPRHSSCDQAQIIGVKPKPIISPRGARHQAFTNTKRYLHRPSAHRTQRYGRRCQWGLLAKHWIRAGWLLSGGELLLLLMSLGN